MTRTSQLIDKYLNKLYLRKSMAKNNSSITGKLNSLDMNKVSKGLLIALTGAAVAFLVQIPEAIDFGTYQGIAVAVSSTVVNLLRKWLSNNS